MTLTTDSVNHMIRSAAAKGAFIVCLSFALIGSAAAKTYDCVFSTGVSSTSWITGNYIIQHDEKAGRATVIDALIHAFEGKPIEVEDIKATDSKLVFLWEVRTKDASGQQARMRYRAAWFKGQQYMRISAQPLGYSNMFEAQGSCTVK